MLQPYKVGESYMFRTVTHIITGRVAEVGELEIVVTDAAWIADTGRYAEAVASGDFNEVEPYPDGEPVIVGRTTITDAVRIPKLPRVQK
jgi:hypothetical protein